MNIGKTARLALAVSAALLLSTTAEARTLYVNAKRPNNKGNGLKATTAKKTIQAAINIAKKGDTILVYPGTYAPIKTNNKKITIKATSGKNKTTVSYNKNHVVILNCGSGKNTKFAGFSVAGAGYNSQWANYEGGTAGGTFSKCAFDGVGCGGYPTFNKSAFVDCVFASCYGTTFGNGGLMSKCTLNRCEICNAGPLGGEPTISSSKLYNCLVRENGGVRIVSCVLANCTVAKNSWLKMKSTKAYNTIFHKVAASQFKKSKKNTLKNCYKGSNPKFVKAGGTATVAKTLRIPVVLDYGDEYELDYDYDSENGLYIYWDSYSESDVVRYVNKTVNVEVDVPADYHLAKGSPCINKGTKAASVKKLFGKKDLDGKKRVKGKSVDIGCYEY